MVRCVIWAKPCKAHRVTELHVAKLLKSTAVAYDGLQTSEVPHNYPSHFGLPRARFFLEPLPKSQNLIQSDPPCIASWRLSSRQTPPNGSRPTSVLPPASSGDFSDFSKTVCPQEPCVIRLSTKRSNLLEVHHMPTVGTIAL